MIRALGLAASLVLALAGLAACQSTVVPTPAPASASSLPASPAPASPVPSAVSVAPSPSPSLRRPDPGADAPPIADPYWLGVGGPSSIEVKDAGGNVTRKDHGMTYEILLGGEIVDGILVDGRAVGNLEWTISEDGNGLPLASDAMEGQIPDGEAMTRTQKHVGDVDVTFVESSSPDVEYHAAYWWAADHVRWYSVVAFDQPDSAGIVEALNAP